MFEFLRSIVPITVRAFVISTMLHVGLTQPPRAILKYFRNWAFVLKMIIANFVAAPLLMYLILRFTSFARTLDAGLFVFSLCAGAPFLIKLTERARHDLALGAFTMMLLMVLTVPYVPLVLPRVIQGLQVDAWEIARELLVQLLLPIVLGMMVAQLAPAAAARVTPALGRFGNSALYAVIGATLIGYWPSLRHIIGSGAILAALVFVAGAFAIGYLAGWGTDHHEDIGALGTAQRNLAAGLIIATQNFDDPDVLMIMTIASTLGIVLLMFIARALARDNPPHVINV